MLTIRKQCHFQIFIKLHVFDTYKLQVYKYYTGSWNRDKQLNACSKILWWNFELTSFLYRRSYSRFWLVRFVLCNEV